ncbi:1-(5-phosphoribosyl)-5-[(5-phosphoribosylamino)methylideneamino] imidazole-4-carboxamide isomerase [Marinihelvus fidelis]|uniref:1-(5-phosphoribosyl)-5-[(5-phosphoribosylamino)methylideneamino] imidazole-4-carboxamide isomerase n=1 Tax=Marinihelvus fidelis TaxID=2613842 RepID=A0A5N0TC28_9GAMM|nr:1-(5-phosphoribosyl)-5-[(5-phosphoribosylamino)methylideneamino] imidazole-4-carboxamide isomerase [Marinihelvus fidelis]KAA9131386.1 1-(5-phosphoribosyl)-5-[(5-phosphoribosylamino)methylideneamino] imidazole-4-carboxamide isomerase [Marinihelvus fidelis]
MKLIPAIDLLDGQCVRLYQGDFGQVQAYEATPEDIAETYREAGAEWLHLVDLEASRDGEGADTSALFELLERIEIKVQTGGGVRDEGDIAERLSAGAGRVVVGSMAASDPDRFVTWLERFGADYLVAALDVRLDKNGLPWPRIYGWTEGAGVDLWTLLDQLVAGGLKHALVTDIGRDGAMKGPNVALYKDIVRRYPQLQLQASGGVSTIDDLRALAATGAAGAITGKALLDGRFSVAEALHALDDRA